MTAVFSAHPIEKIERKHKPAKSLIWVSLIVATPIAIQIVLRIGDINNSSLTCVTKFVPVNDSIVIVLSDKPRPNGRGFGVRN